jgi:hypothetical protein
MPVSVTCEVSNQLESTVISSMCGINFQRRTLNIILYVVCNKEP